MRLETSATPLCVCVCVWGHVREPSLKVVSHSLYTVWAFSKNEISVFGDTRVICVIPQMSTGGFSVNSVFEMIRMLGVLRIMHLVCTFYSLHTIVR